MRPSRRSRSTTRRSRCSVRSCPRSSRSKLRRATSAGALLAALGRDGEAEEELRAAYDIHRRTLDPHDLQIAQDANDLAIFLDRARRPEESEPLFLAALAGYRRVLGESHPTVAQLYDSLGAHLAQTGRTEVALPMLETALEMRRELLGAHHGEVARTLGHLGDAARVAGDSSRAEQAWCDALEIAREAGPAYDDELGSSAFKLARLELARQDHALALEHARIAYDVMRASHPESHPARPLVESVLGQSLMHSGRLAEADELLTASVARLESSRGAEHPDTREVKQHLERPARAPARTGEFLERRALTGARSRASRAHGQ
jgi:tetratricopeptide (TPR) repeat protein